MVVCDLDRFEIHTNFTGTVKRVYAFDLDGLSDAENLDVLRRVFTDPESLRPGQTTEAVTEQAAELIGQIADGMRVRGIPAHDAAHFLMKLMFSMFAEDIGLLKNKVFAGILKSAKDKPAVLAQRMQALFEAMSTGGYFGADEVLHFNGGLFADATVIELRPAEIRNLVDVNALDWSDVEPSIFGTLFERMLDPHKRSQIGAHYTSRADIETLLQPVVMQPLRREWDAVKAECDALWPKIKKVGRDVHRKPTAKASPARKKFDKLLSDFTGRLEDVTILDPACGSGNFLYVALNLLLDLNKEVISYAAQHGMTLFPSVRPTQLFGIEINEYAQELASVVIWIGCLQWMHDNGFTPQLDPVLEPFESIRRMDAILDLSDPENPREPEWPAAEFIVGNPPFLGNRLMSAHFSDDYIEALSAVYEERMGGRPDICCYWFEKARDQIARKRSQHAGLLATQGIRGGTNRNVLKRIKSTGDIFFAIADREWILDGAMVHVSMVGFDAGSEKSKQLNGKAALAINPDLSEGADITCARRLRANAGVSFQGGIKRGSFDVADAVAQQFLSAGGNPRSRPNSDILLPYLNATDVTRENRHVWIIHFGKEMPIERAATYQEPFEYLEKTVRPERQGARQETARDRWWVHWNVRAEMELALRGLDRWIVTPRVSKHRVFTWVSPPNYVDNALVAFARDDDYTFGVLHSIVHEVWARAQGTQLRERESGFRYTPTTCFETFPYPEPTDAQRKAIATAAKELDDLRNNWLKPNEWIRTEVLTFRGSITGPWKRYIVPESTAGDGAGVVHYPRTVPRGSECARELKKRTLTNLYNRRPKWLEIAHQRVDAAVLAAYGWTATAGADDLLSSLLELNYARAAIQ